MQKLSFIGIIMLLLVAVPAFSAVKLIVEPQGGGVAAIKYEVTNGEKVAAFALDVTVDAGTIDSISDFHVGQSTADERGFGIFPGSFARYIVVDPVTGDVNDWAAGVYTPIADPNDPGALGGLGTNGITLEMGTLYASDENAPENTGILCKVTVSQSCKMSVALNRVRGGIVLMDPAVQVDPNLAQAQNIEVAGDEGGCFPKDNPAYDAWVALGRPQCWCQAFQCDGDADGKAQGQLRITSDDLDILVKNWKKKIGDANFDPCADIDHQAQGPQQYRVSTNDLSILISNWKKTDSSLAGNCPRK